MKITATEKLLLLPFTPRVRSAAIFAGILSAIFTGGLPFVGYGPALAMGRVIPLVSPVAFILHLMFGIVYGAILSLTIGRSRGWWTLTTALGSTVLFYYGNLWLTRVWNFPLIATDESRAVMAHLIFVLAFTIRFKLRETDVAEFSTPHARAR